MNQSVSQGVPKVKMSWQKIFLGENILQGCPTTCPNVAFGALDWKFGNANCNLIQGFQLDPFLKLAMVSK